MTTVLFHHDPQVVRRYLYFSRVVGVSMCAIGLVVLVGWWWRLPWLTAGLPGDPSMTATAAIEFVLSGAALLLSHTSRQWRSRVGSVLSLGVLGLGTVTLCEVVCALDLGIDEWIRNPAAALSNLPPSYMRPVIAVALALLGGLGLLVAVQRWLWLREALAIALLAIAM